MTVTRRRISMLLASVAAFSMAAVFAPAAAGSAAAGAQPCGYSEEGGEAYYHNCSSDGRIIRVAVSDAPSFETCAMPGVTHLGSAPPITSAFVVPHSLICG